MPFRRFSRLSRERTEWVGAISVTPTVVAVGALSQLALIVQGALEEFTQPKLVRVMGSIFVSPSTAPANPSGYGVFLGISRLPNVGAGTIQPDPELNLEWQSWLWWQLCFPQIGGTAVADSNASRWVGYFRFDVNIRSRIRFREDDTLNLFVKNSASSAAGIQYSVAFRFLLAAGRK